MTHTTQCCAICTDETKCLNHHCGSTSFGTKIIAKHYSLLVICTSACKQDCVNCIENGSPDLNPSSQFCGIQSGSSEKSERGGNQAKCGRDKSKCGSSSSSSVSIIILRTDVAGGGAGCSAPSNPWYNRQLDCTRAVLWVSLSENR